MKSNKWWSFTQFLFFIKKKWLKIFRTIYWKISSPIKHFVSMISNHRNQKLIYLKNKEFGYFSVAISRNLSGFGSSGSTFKLNFFFSWCLLILDCLSGKLFRNRLLWQIFINFRQTRRQCFLLLSRAYTSSSELNKLR